jgi:hypothetical protein
MEAAGVTVFTTGADDLRRLIPRSHATRAPPAGPISIARRGPLRGVGPPSRRENGHGGSGRIVGRPYGLPLA